MGNIRVSQMTTELPRDACQKNKKSAVLSVNVLNLCLTIREGGVTLDALQNYSLVNCYQVYIAHSIYYVCLSWAY